MKTFISLLILTFSFFSHADISHFNVKEGKLHKGGALTIEVLEATSEFKVNLKYELYKRAWVPVPNDQLKGEETTTLPPQFKDERGYLELEQLGQITIPEATIKFIKRLDHGLLKNAYLIEVIAKNGKSSTQVIYHPQVSSPGWAHIEIRLISNISALNGYKIVAELK